MDDDYLILEGGTIIDPQNRDKRWPGDIWISKGRIVAPPPEQVLMSANVARIDCSGRVIMPGGIDMHSHIVGPKVNVARKLQPELFQNRMGEFNWQTAGNRTVPTVIDTGLKYVGMGYTTVMDAAISPLAARQVHAELEQLPVVDSGFYLLAGNNHRLLRASATGDVDDAARFLAWLLTQCGGYAPKVVNPGGIELWKSRRDANARDIDQKIDGWNTTPRKILGTISAAANQIGLPHPIHIHCNNLGMPGNWETTLQTMESVAGMRAHLTHIQFHSYGGENQDPGSIGSMSQRLIDHVNAHPELSVDVGQVLFGRTTSMTGDGPLGHWLSELSGEKWYSCDTEIESGCGVSPIEYRDRDTLNSIQWAIGLEWYLGVKNPWQVVMSTDHPNGASFLAYPQIIRLLMDANYRREKLASLPTRLSTRTRLADFDRCYTLEEIAIITRAGPARLLGLNDKGHLGPGAIADVAIYTPDDNPQTMFELPWMVIKSGQIVLRDHEMRSLPLGITHAISQIDTDSSREFSTWYNQHYSLNCAHLGRGRNESKFKRPVSVANR